MHSDVSIGIAASLETLFAEWMTRQPPVQQLRQGPTTALVLAPGVRFDIRTGVVAAVDTGQPVSVIQARSGLPALSLASALRRSRWQDVDVDAIAPRLRHVRLPREVAESGEVGGVSDLREHSSTRPLIALGLWALIASPVQRISSLITGQREGLTAEIGLAVNPAALIAIASLTARGPLVGIVSADPIATELVALAIWQSRLPSTIDLPGPWEDPLVQRATELGLGVSQPAQLIVQATFCDDLAGSDVDTARRVLDGSLSLIGISDVLPGR